MIRKSVFRELKKYIRRIPARGKALLVGIGVVTIGVFIINMQSHNNIPQTAYTPLLNVIAEGESKGNYNAYFGNAGNKTLKITDMTVAEILKWQEDYVTQGAASSAVGRYQIIRPTLLGLIDTLNVRTDERFDAHLQDKLAISLIERRGAIDFANNKLTAEQFAHELSKEWAALPRIVGGNADDSYYAGDGLNKSLIDSQTSLAAINEFKTLTK